MHPYAPFLAVPLLIGSAITFSLAIYAWSRRGEPGVAAFLCTSVGLAAWSLFYSIEIMSAEFATKLLWHRLVYTTLVLVPGPWALFLYHYDTRTTQVPRWVPWALAVEPLLFVLLTWTNDHFHQLLWREILLSGTIPELEFVRGPFFWVHTGYSYILIVIATFFFVRMLARAPDIARWQLVILGFAAFLPLLVNIIHVLKWTPFHPLDLTPFALATAGTAASWYAFRFEIWDFLPAARSQIVESLNDGVIVLDVDHVVVDINPAALTLLAVGRNEAVGFPVGRLLPNWDGWARTQGAASASWEQELPCAGGVYYVDLIYLTLRNRNRRLTGALLTLRNVTRRRLAEEALVEERTMLSRRVEEQTADLRRANAELARAARMKDEFLANMSHELRTPLNTILGLSEALQEQVYGALHERQVRALRNIEESGRHLLALINDILDVSKIEAGKLTLELQPVDVESVCQSSLGLVRQSAHKKRIDVRYTPDPTVTLMQADERRLKQILVNLLSNAVKFTPEDGAIGLTVTGDRRHERVNFTVWDTGVGIAEADVRRLFQPFIQLDSQLTRRHEGSGLGLALVYRMAELHGGGVNVESAVGQGTRFIVSLPWREPELPRLAPDEGATDAALAHLRRVLLIDNSPATVDQVRRYLLELGVETIVAPEDENPVMVAQRTQPDLIIMDVLYSSWPGIDLLSELRRQPETCTIPLLVLSVASDALAKEPPAADGGSPISQVVKPLSRQQLGQALVRTFASAAKNNGATAHPTRPHTVVTGGDAPLILIVEDNETNIRTLVDYLTAKALRLEVARNGAEVLPLARSQRPDLILMDIQMPDMDGITAIRLIRADGYLNTIPIIALTALAMPGDRERTLAAGANDYLSKPVSLKGLAQMIEAHLESRE
jgi:signal transduction histidine kinase/CheY-like chemotaxis protein